MLINDTMRIGYVLKRYPRYSETFIVNEILAHEAAGLSIEIFALRPLNDTHFQDMISRVKAPVHYLPSEIPKTSIFWKDIVNTSIAIPGLWTALENTKNEDVRNIYQAILLAREVHQKGIDHLHAHFANVATSVVRMAAKFAGIHYSFTAHAKDIFHESVDQDDLLCKINDAASVITISDYNVKYLNNTCASLGDHIQLIYNGLDLKKYPFKTPDSRLPRIVSVGRLVEKKGFKTLIEACAILVSRGISFNCQIIGTGPLYDELRTQITQLNIREYVELMGSLPREELNESVQNAAIFAAPCIIGKDSDRDGLPTVLLEAMALGTPCVSTNISGIPEVVYHGETGLIVPQNDPVELADALEGLFSDSALRVHLAIKARQLIEEKFDIHLNSANIREVFQSIKHINVAQKVN